MICTFQNNAAHNEEKTNALHHEVATHTNHNITAETHPTLYNLVEQLTIKAHVPMPRYITIYSAEYHVVSQAGVVRRRGHEEIGAHVDLLKDLYVCREILENASYDEVKGIIALALAEESINKLQKVVLTGVTTFATTIALIYLLNKKYDLHLGSFLCAVADESSRRSYRYREDDSPLAALFWLVLTPSLIAAKLVSNNLQKSVDFKAAKLVSPQSIIDSLKKIVTIKDSYFKENVFSRLASALKLKTIFNTIFYPIRAFTTEERIQYLEKQAV